MNDRNKSLKIYKTSVNYNGVKMAVTTAKTQEEQPQRPTFGRIKQAVPYEAMLGVKLGVRMLTEKPAALVLDGWHKFRIGPVWMDCGKEAVQMEIVKISYLKLGEISIAAFTKFGYRTVEEMLTDFRASRPDMDWNSQVTLLEFDREHDEALHCVEPRR